MRFHNKIAVITGAGSGIGKAAAERLAKEGATVILAGRTKEKLEAARDSINQQCGAEKAHLFQSDVTKEEDVQGLAQFAGKFGPPHIVINNAGGSGQSKILETSSEDWDFVQKANLKSVFLVSKILGSLMKDDEEGRRSDRSIVNVASLSAYKAGAHIPHYSAAKAGVVNFTKALALELSPYGVRVNSVSPGFIETPLTEGGLKNAKFTESIERSTALRRVGKPEEIANIIALAASSEASYMTGTDLLADGGWLIV
ncbi:SDR family NAD(P)-dependent oxidoreductase [Metabacillus sp. RGM 3146]|uniref:SDR family NAD(P)-dependent oxidoreductase n=1 Tax=Metabacillus sp. RGM 3146 TaxID=3401092 RepID=UPI003B9979D3